ncbi:MAG: hypothetical protein DWQ05_22160 [Calditrichaeota bacterium]|nr:MAG: hypothetical protein DWQ05_22160 [Calditrichota bacterium]
MLNNIQNALFPWLKKPVALNFHLKQREHDKNQVKIFNFTFITNSQFDDEQELQCFIFKRKFCIFRSPRESSD